MNRLIISAAAALILAGGFFMPSFITGLKDRQTIEEYTVADSSSISFETKSELGILDRLRMITSVGSIPLENGDKLKSDTAYQCALTELARLNAGGWMAFDFENCQMYGYYISFYVDSIDPAKNMIVWHLNLGDEAGRAIYAAVDDETGILLSLEYYTKDASGEIYYEKVPNRGTPGEPDYERYYDKLIVDPEKLKDSVADYYGLETGSMEYIKDSVIFHYELELRDGSASTKLQVVITGAELWFNI